MYLCLSAVSVGRKDERSCDEAAERPDPYGSKLRNNQRPEQTAGAPAPYAASTPSSHLSTIPHPIAHDRLASVPTR